jgi:hypothetical protein
MDPSQQQYPQPPYTSTYDPPPAPSPYDPSAGYGQAYGYPPPSAYPGYAPMPQKTSGMAVASLVLSLLGLAPLPLVGSVLGVIFGHMGLGEIKRSGGTLDGQGLAVAGLVIGYISLGLALIGICFFALIVLIALGNAGTTSFALPGLFQ